MARPRPLPGVLIPATVVLVAGLGRVEPAEDAARICAKREAFAFPRRRIPVVRSVVWPDVAACASRLHPHRPVCMGRALPCVDVQGDEAKTDEDVVAPHRMVACIGEYERVGAAVLGLDLRPRLGTWWAAVSAQCRSKRMVSCPR